MLSECFRYQRVAVEVKLHIHGKGILACGSGIGASIAANKIPGIRAALVENKGFAQ